jgi:hypothetical protein
VKAVIDRQSPTFSLIDFLKHIWEKEIFYPSSLASKFHYIILENTLNFPILIDSNAFKKLLAQE